MKKPLCILIYLILLSFSSYAQVEFIEHQFGGEISTPWGLCVADFDNDGDYDVAVAGYGGYVYVYEQAEEGTFTAHLIGDNSTCDVTIYNGDIDGDGDQDIVGTTVCTSILVWWENEGEFEFTEHVIGENVPQLLQISLVDIDLDGDLDIITPLHNYEPYIHEIRIWFNDGEGQFFYEIIAEEVNAWGIEAADLNQDGNIDILYTDYFAENIFWLEQTEDFEFVHHEIEANLNHAFDMVVDDLDHDGDLDIAAAGYSSSPIKWYENDGNQLFTEHLLNLDNSYTHLTLADINLDGRLDIIASSSGGGVNLILFLNTPEGVFEEHIIDANNGELPHESLDFDFDGDVDIVQGKTYLISWWENQATPDFPIPFDLVEPHDESMLNEMPVTLQWTSAHHPIVIDSITYQVQLSRYEDFHAIHYYDAGIDTLFLLDNLLSDTEYWWRIRAINQRTLLSRYSNQEWSFITPFFNAVDPGLSGGILPHNFQLTTFPNPFNATLNLTVGLPSSSQLEIEIFNLYGQMVSQVIDGHYGEGLHDFTFDMTGHPSGIYFIQATISGDMNEIRKVVLLK